MAVDLGGKTLQFVETPLLHWPDSMETFLPELGIFFSNDDEFSQARSLVITQRFDKDYPGARGHGCGRQKSYANLLACCPRRCS